LFDPKPALKNTMVSPCQLSGQDQMYAFIPNDAGLFASPFKFARYGKSGAEMSELLPNISKSTTSQSSDRWLPTINHAPAQMFLFSGSVQFGSTFRMGYVWTWERGGRPSGICCAFVSGRNKCGFGALG
jgi:hypothetical protein